jgi:hypothetical protein
LTSVVVPTGVRELDTGAFEACASQRSVVRGDGPTTVGAGVFKDCKALPEVAVPGWMAVLPDSTLEGCERPEVAFLPEGGIELGNCADRGWKSLLVLDLLPSLLQFGGGPALPGPSGSVGW